MGREIRRVPPDWDHPRDTSGECIPLFDQDYDTAASDWIAAMIAWEDGRDTNRVGWEDGRRRYYWEWTDNPPDRAAYRDRAWTADEATCVQLYENVTEGTPVSPVLPSVDALRTWLAANGDADLVDGWLLGEAWHREYRRRVLHARATGTPLVAPTYDELRTTRLVRRPCPPPMLSPCKKLSETARSGD